METPFTPFGRGDPRVTQITADDARLLGIDHDDPHFTHGGCICTCPTCMKVEGYPPNITCICPNCVCREEGN